MFYKQEKNNVHSQGLVCYLFILRITLPCKEAEDYLLQIGYNRASPGISR